MKIENIKIKNFKSLKNIDLDLKNLNLITGINSMGKSSLIQALLLLKQNEEKFFSTRGEKIVNINDTYIKLGNKKDILFEEVFQENIEISISSGKENHTLCFETQNLKIGNIRLLPEKKENNLNIFFEDFQYIQTDRITPQIAYQLSDEMINKNLIGFRGEYSAHYLAKNRHYQILEKIKHPNSKTLQLLENVSCWLSDISENIEVKANIFDSLQQADLKYSYIYGDKTTQDLSPLNVGFGITYVLPIVLSILKAKEGDLIIIENPETHLHPKAQSKLAELFAISSSCGVQIILETHSDHILNGIRIAIKNSILDSNDSKIYYFRKERDKLETIIDNIIIDENGVIDNYPEGFFDQFDNDLDTLLGL